MQLATSLPRWVSQPSQGRRQAKKPASWYPSYNPTRDLPVLWKPAATDLDGWRPKHFNDWQDYRYWSGGEFSPWWRCRFCGLSGDNRFPARHKADTASECYKALDILYEKLRRANKCVACDSNTMACTWGVPLCFENTRCHRLWMFTYQRPKALEDALTVARMVGELP